MSSHRRASDVDELTDRVYRPAPDDLRVRLLLEPDVAWVAESYPTESVVSRAGDRLEVVLAVSGSAFLDRLLLALGERATVLDPPEARAQLAGGREPCPRALRRVLVTRPRRRTIGVRGWAAVESDA